MSLTEAYDNRSVMAQIARIKDRLTAVEQNVDPTLRTDLEAAIADLEALETTVGTVSGQVEANTGDISDLETAVAGKASMSEVETALAGKADVTQLTDGSVTKVGTADVGNNNGNATSAKPIILVGGVPTPVTNILVDVKHDATLDGLMKPSRGFGMCKTSTAASLGSRTDCWVEIGTWQSGTLSATCRSIIEAHSGQAISLAAIVEGFMLGGNGYARYDALNANNDGKVIAVKCQWRGSDNSFVFYAHITKTTTSLSANRFLAEVTTSAAFTGTAGGTTVYEDVESGGVHYPNITNYLQYVWTDLGATYVNLGRA